MNHVVLTVFSGQFIYLQLYGETVYWIAPAIIYDFKKKKKKGKIWKFLCSHS